MTPELDLILGLLSRNLELTANVGAHAPNPPDRFLPRSAEASIWKTGYTTGYEKALRDAAEEIRRARAVLDSR